MEPTSKPASHAKLTTTKHMLIDNKLTQLTSWKSYSSLHLIWFLILTLESGQWLVLFAKQDTCEKCIANQTFDLKEGRISSTRLQLSNVIVLLNIN